MQTKGHLLRVLGVVFGLAAVVGSVVGQGILRTPGVVAQASGSATVLLGLWALGAVLSLLLALPYVELGSAIPRADGPQGYVGLAFGRAPEVVIAFMSLLMQVSSMAMICYVIGEFLVRLGIGDGLSPGVMGTAMLLLFFVLNAMGTRSAGAIQVTLAALKGAVLLGLVVVLFAQPGAAPPAGDPGPALAGWQQVATAILLIISTYNGWGDVVFYGEEIDNPGRAIPRAIFGGILGVSVLYLLVNAAMFHVIAPTTLAGSDFAAADAAKGVFGGNAGKVFTAFGILSLGAIANLNLMTVTRIAFASARSGILPRKLEAVSALGTPMWALVAVTLVSAAFILSGTYLTLAATSTALAQGLFLAVTAAAIGLRRSQPNLQRPFAIPAFAVSMALVVAINLGLMVVFVAQDPFNALLGFVLVGALSASYFLLAPRSS
ncbi:MAG: hypothetical protein RL339_2359 [Pseudomonadota bacterium]|jgi:APA family basic amino acid/polyamine antiporter